MAPPKEKAKSSAIQHRPRLSAARVLLVSTSLLACALVMAAYIATTFFGTAILFRMGHHQLLNAVAHGNLYLEMKGKEVWEEGDRHSAYGRMLQSRRKMFMWSQDDINLRSCSASARIPLPVFMALFLVLPIRTGLYYRRLLRRRCLGQCLFCGYDLRGAAQGRCSECGEEFSRIEKTK